MKKILFCLAAVLMTFSFVGCDNTDNGETTKAKILGSWSFDESQTTYSAGLLLAVSGNTSVIDTSTVISTVKTLFGNSEMTFNADTSGVIKKNIVEETTNDPTSLAGILNNYVGEYLQKAFVYSVKSSKISVKLDSKSYKLTVLSATETQLKVSMPITDLTSWMTSLLGDKVSSIANSDIFATIEQIAGTLGVYASPTVVLTFDKVE
jgi:hypothetical protein